MIDKVITERNNIPFISIIIPVYNGGAHYLDECLSSIWSQPIDLNDIEVICVDDCSTDNTLQYVEQEAIYHTNLKIIRTERNLRQGGARNRGIKAAQGEYIMFIDQDDYFHNDAIKIAIDFLRQNNLEVMVCDSAWQIREKENENLQHNFTYNHLMKGTDFLIFNGIPYAPWKFIIQKSFLLENNLFFEENVRIEDVDWALKLTCLANKMQYQPILLIHYNRGEGSITWDAYKDIQTVFDTVRLGNRIYLMSETISNDPQVCQRVCQIGDFFLAYSLRLMFGLFINPNIKAKCIRENIPYTDDFHSDYILIRIAQRLPFLFGLVSTMGMPFYVLLLWAYRKIKY